MTDLAKARLVIFCRAVIVVVTLMISSPSLKKYEFTMLRNALAPVQVAASSKPNAAAPVRIVGPDIVAKDDVPESSFPINPVCVEFTEKPS